MGALESPLPASSESALNGRSIAVFGATGFIGSRLVERLTEAQGTKVVVAVRNPKRAARMFGLSARVQKVNLRKPSSINEAISDCDLVFNLAYDLRASGEDNLSGFNNLVSACVTSGIELLVHTSSIAVYDDWPERDLTEHSPCGRAGSEYKNAKAAMENTLARLATDGSLRSVILQPTIVYGPHARLWTDHFVERLSTGTVILPDDGQGLCNAVYVDDVADAMILAAIGKPADCERFIISGAQPVTWREYLESITEALAVDSVEYVESKRLGGSRDRTPWRLQSLTRSPLVRRSLNMAYEIAGPDAIQRIKSIVFERRRRRRNIVYQPTPAELTLYTSRGRCSIAKARERLGYEPAFDFVAGSRVTGEYIKRKYLSPTPSS
jgi:nucleoside-diphosphate-sugar epimerase